MNKKYYVYILLTVDNTYYCGFTTNVQKRFDKHIKGLGAKYTKIHKPLKIVWQKQFDNKSDALKEEYRIKHKLTRNEKIKLIKTCCFS